MPLRACLHGDGAPQAGEVTRLGGGGRGGGEGVTRLSLSIYNERFNRQGFTPPNAQVSSPIWGPSTTM